MHAHRKALALALGAMTALSAAVLPGALAQQPGGNPAAPETLVVEDAVVDWIQHSEVAALIEGNVEQIELEVGMPVLKGAPIGNLHNTKAKLAVAKAKVGADGKAAIEKANAQYNQALSVVARNERMEKKNPGIVPREDVEKAKADWDVTKAMILEAKENQALARAELDLAINQLEEHTIKAPFDGVVIKVLRKAGESVGAREAVIEMGNLEKLQVYAFVPLEYVFRLKEGMVVEFQQRGTGPRPGGGPDASKVKGKLTFIHPELQAVGETAVKIFAEFDNQTGALRPGMKGTLVIYLDGGNAAPRVGRAAPADEPGVIPASATAPIVAPAPAAPAGSAELPPLPPR